MITIGIPMSGRLYAFDGFTEGLELINGKEEINLVIANCSNDPNFKLVLDHWLNKQTGWKSVKYFEPDVPIIRENDTNVAIAHTHKKRMQAIAQNTEATRQEILKTDCKYGWIIEDDNGLPPLAKERHLAAFKFIDRVGATGCYATQRWATNGLNRVPLVWNFEENEKSDSRFGTRFEHEAKKIISVQGYVPQKGWLQVVGATTFGSIMMNREVLERIKHEREYKGVVNHDVNFGLKLMELDYKLVIDWSIKVKHIHFDEVIY